MEDTKYTIKFTDKTVDNKNDITIVPNAINKSTTLLLHGRGSPNFGKDLWENLLHLLENFCSNNTPPLKATEGQLWFDASTKKLSVYTRDGTNYKWNTILIDGVPNDYFKTSELTDILSKYVRKEGDEMFGSLQLISDMNLEDPIITDEENKLNAVTREYVDYYIKDINGKIKPPDTVTGEAKDYIVRSSDATDDERTMLNHLILPTEFKTDNELTDEYNKDNSNNYSVTKKDVYKKVSLVPSTSLPEYKTLKNNILYVDNASNLKWLPDTDYLKKSVGGKILQLLQLSDKDYDGTKYSDDLTIAASRNYVKNYVTANISSYGIDNYPTSINRYYIEDTMMKGNEYDVDKPGYIQHQNASFLVTQNYNINDDKTIIKTTDIQSSPIVFSSMFFTNLNSSTMEKYDNHTTSSFIYISPLKIYNDTGGEQSFIRSGLMLSKGSYDWTLGGTSYIFNHFGEYDVTSLKYTGAYEEYDKEISLTDNSDIHTFFMNYQKKYDREYEAATHSLGGDYVFPLIIVYIKTPSKKIHIIQFSRLTRYSTYGSDYEADPIYLTIKQTIPPL